MDPLLEGGGRGPPAARALPGSEAHREQHELALKRAIPGTSEYGEYMIANYGDSDDPVYEYNPKLTAEHNEALKRAFEQATQDANDDAWLDAYVANQKALPNFGYNPMPKCKNKTARAKVAELRELRARLEAGIQSRERRRLAANRRRRDAMQEGGSGICANEQDIEQLDKELKDLYEALRIVKNKVRFSEDTYKMDGKRPMGAAEKHAELEMQEHDGTENQVFEYTGAPLPSAADFLEADDEVTDLTSASYNGPRMMSALEMIEKQSDDEDEVVVRTGPSAYDDDPEDEVNMPFPNEVFRKQVPSDFDGNMTFRKQASSDNTDDMDDFAGTVALEDPGSIEPRGSKGKLPPLDWSGVPSSGYGTQTMRRPTRGGGRTFTAIHAVLAAVVVAASFL